jgi:hypothetical protein
MKKKTLAFLLLPVILLLFAGSASGPPRSRALSGIKRKNVRLLLSAEVYKSNPNLPSIFNAGRARPR